MNCIYQYWVNATIDPISETESKLHEISKKSIVEYASNIGVMHIYDNDYYDLVKKSDHQFKHLFNWLRIIYDPYFDNFDNVLFLDADVVVNKNADNIFDEIESGADILGCQEYKEYNGSENRKDSEYVKSILQINEVPIILYNGHVRHINSGVMVFTKKGRMLARENFEDFSDYYYKELYPLPGHNFLFLDEFYLSCMLNKFNFNVQVIDHKWNFNIKNNSKGIENMNFYHIAGSYEHKLNTIEDMINNYVQT